jgi:outer membrane protein assembly factor BamB
MAGVVSAATHAPRVSEPTPAREPAPISAQVTRPAWSLPWTSGVLQVIERGDELTISGRDRFAILSAKTGALRVEKSFQGCAGAGVDPAGLLLARCGEKETELAALDAGSLEPMWRVKLGARIQTVTARADLVVAKLEGNQLVALEKGRGDVRWRASVPSQASIVIEEDRRHVYAFEADPTVWAYDRATGKLAWSRPEKLRITDMKPWADDTLALELEDGLHELDARTGAELRLLSSQTMSTIDAPWLYTFERPDDRWFRGARLRAVHLAAGHTWVYRRPLGDWPPTARGDVIYACSETGVLHAIDRARGERVWWADIGTSCAVTPLAGGKVLVDDGERLLALDPSQPRAAEPAVTVRGRFRNADGRPQRHVRIWLGDVAVKTGPGGAFTATLPRRDTITVRVDPRDIDGSSEPVVLHPLAGDKLRVELRSWYEDCH